MIIDKNYYLYWSSTKTKIAQQKKKTKKQQKKDKKTEITANLTDTIIEYWSEFNEKQ